MLTYADVCLVSSVPAMHLRTVVAQAPGCRSAAEAAPVVGGGALGGRSSGPGNQILALLVQKYKY
jgi:hypothetical protein